MPRRQVGDVAKMDGICTAILLPPYGLPGFGYCSWIVSFVEVIIPLSGFLQVAHSHAPILHLPFMYITSL